MKAQLEPVRIAAATLIAFAVYLAGISPFIYWADSGELTLGGFSLGLAHPPSFPVYALFLKGLSFLPLGDVALRSSLASALCGALAVGGVYALASWLLARPIPRPARAARWRGGRTAPAAEPASLPHVDASSTGAAALEPASPGDTSAERMTEVMPAGVLERPRFPALGAAVAALTFAVSPQTWEVSVRQEVYTLHLIFALAIVALVLVWARARRPGLLIAAGFLFGLAMGNHSLLILALFPPLLMFMLWIDARAALRARLLGWTVAAFLLGLSAYLYLPLRSSSRPFLDWNSPRHLAGFLESFTKKSEAGLFIGKGALASNLETFGAALVDAFTPWLVGLAALGLLPLVRRDRRVAVLLFGLLAFNVTSVVMGPSYDWDNPDIPGYLLLTWTVVALCLGEGVRRGVHALAERLEALGARVASSRARLLPALALEASSRARLLPALALAIVAVVAWRTASARLPQPADDRARAFGLLHLSAAPAGALVLSKSDPVTFLGWYLQKVEGRRPDVWIINRKGLGDRYYRAGLEAIDPALFAPPAPGGVGTPPVETDAGLESERPDAIDRTPQLGPEIARLLASNLPRRPILWEGGRDNRWVLARSRPRGPLFEVGLEPVRLTMSDHRENLAFQRRFLARMAPGGLVADPRAGRAMEVTLFNLANALTREEAAPAPVIARAFGALWTVRPGFRRAGNNYAFWSFMAKEYPRAEAAYRRLLADGDDDVAVWSGLAATLGSEGKREEALEVIDAGLARHPRDPGLLHNRRMLTSTAP